MLGIFEGRVAADLLAAEPAAWEAAAPPAALAAAWPNPRFELGPRPCAQVASALTTETAAAMARIESLLLMHGSFLHLHHRVATPMGSTRRSKDRNTPHDPAKNSVGAELMDTHGHFTNVSDHSEQYLQPDPAKNISELGIPGDPPALLPPGPADPPAPIAVVLG